MRFNFFSAKPKKKEESAAFSFPLSEEGFRDLVFSVEEKELRSRLPDLTGKRVLEMAPRQKLKNLMTGLLKEKGAKVIARVGGTKEKEMGVGPGETFLLSHWESLPFLDKSSDLVLLRLAFLKGSVNHPSLGRLLREAGRILAPQGTVLLADLHPFSTTVQREHLKNPIGEEGLGPGFERYVKWIREAGLKLEWVKESFFEGGMKKFFTTEGEKRQFDQIRRTPFLIFFQLKKE